MKMTWVLGRVTASSSLSGISVQRQKSEASLSVIFLGGIRSGPRSHEEGEISVAADGRRMEVQFSLWVRVLVSCLSSPSNLSDVGLETSQ